jgi:predicted nuclease of predicted toxin-antitoxin system
VKLLLDADLSPLVARMLAARGYDADAVIPRADIPDDISDADLFGRARAEERVIVTANVQDFRRIAAECVTAGPGHAGLILVPGTTPRSRSATKELADAIEQVVLANPDGLWNTERWI